MKIPSLLLVVMGWEGTGGGATASEGDREDVGGGDGGTGGEGGGERVTGVIGAVGGGGEMTPVSSSKVAEVV